MHPSIKTAIADIRTPRVLTILQIAVVFIVPIVLILTGLISIKLRIPVLIGVVSLLVMILYKERWTLGMLGFRRNVSGKTALVYVGFTVVAVIAIAQFGEWIGYEEALHWWTHPHFLYMFMIVSAFQEIAYRGYLIPALGSLSSSPTFIVITNSLLFTLLHAIFPGWMVNLPLAFIGGLCFSILYMRYPNMLLIILSHAVLNFCAVLYGFFMIPGVTY